MVVFNVCIFFLYFLFQRLEEEGQIFHVVRGDKKKVYFYQEHPATEDVELPKEYKTCFRNAFLHGYDDPKIVEDLRRKNHVSCIMSSMKLKTPKKNSIRRRTNVIPGTSIRQNTHVTDLKHYDTINI